MRRFFDRELDTAATFWRVLRKDGVTLGFTSHDRDLWFYGIRHRAAPGMVPAAIRLNADLQADSAEVEGALSHDSIRENDLAAGLYDGAAIEIGLVDWRSLEWMSLYNGSIGRIEDNSGSFAAELRSAKQMLEIDAVPRTSPTCRAVFCGPECGLSASRFTLRKRLDEIDFGNNRVKFSGIVADGQVRFLDGPQTGFVFGVISNQAEWLSLDRPLIEGTSIGTPSEIREGCDHTFATCSGRFANSVNFRGEPFLPGNDLLARYGT
jgi:uncharacterized phage protein (TIGR02218 family)